MKETVTDLSTPEMTVACFFNSLLGPTRNWPRAYSCLAPNGRESFDNGRGLQAFADYWDERLTFLEELVEARHSQYPYTHRSCFAPDNIRLERISSDLAVVTLELLENHVAPERLVIAQSKELSRLGNDWLLLSGKLEGNLNDIIETRKTRGPRAR